MATKPKRRERGISIKIDREQYEKIAAEAKRQVRPFATHLRLILSRYIDNNNPVQP